MPDQTINVNCDTAPEGHCRVESKLNAWIEETRKVHNTLLQRQEMIEALMRGVMGQKGIVQMVQDVKEGGENNAAAIQDIKVRIAQGDIKFVELTTSVNAHTDKLAKVERHIYVAMGCALVIMWFLDKIAAPVAQRAIVDNVVRITPNTTPRP